MTCQKEMMASGKAYPRTCQNCSLGPCKLGYPGYYIPGRDGPLVADPNLLPRTRETNPSPDISAPTSEDDIAETVSRNFRADMERIMAANPPPEIGWLIEINSVVGGPTWWSLTDTEGEGGYFTKESTKALRFARKQDAEAYIEDIGWTEAVATEHEWLDNRGRDHGMTSPDTSAAEVVASPVDEAFAAIRSEIDTLRGQRDRAEHLLTTVIVNLRRGGDPAIVVPALLEWYDGGCK